MLFSNTCDFGNLPITTSICDGSRNVYQDRDQKQDWNQKLYGSDTKTKDWDKLWSGTGPGNI